MVDVSGPVFRVCCTKHGRVGPSNQSARPAVATPSGRDAARWGEARSAHTGDVAKPWSANPAIHALSQPDATRVTWIVSRRVDDRHSLNRRTRAHADRLLLDMSQVHGLAHRWFWSIHSLTWDGWHDPRLPDTRGQQTLAWVRGDAPGAQRILDVGCATGRQSIALANAGYSVVGLDVSPAMCRRARENARRMASAGADLTFLKGNIERDEGLRMVTADVVLLQGVLQCATSPVAMLSRVARSLRLDGVILIEVRDHDAPSPEQRPYRRRARWFLPLKNLSSRSRLVHRFTLRSLLDVTQQAGFAIRRVSAEDGWLRVSARVASAGS